MKNNFWIGALMLFLSATVSTSMHAQCTAGFDTATSGLTLQITNQATGSYNWISYDLGDGFGWIQNVASPSYTYSEPGIYVVCQYIQDTVSFICWDFNCDTIPMGGATCMANFYLNPDGYDLECYNASLGSYTSQVWDFGDGSLPSTQTDPIHTYSQSGVYTVCLSLFDGSSLCDSMCMQVYVGESTCTADFDYSATGLDVDFFNASTGGFNAVYWDFGDGFGFSEDMDPSYTYFTAGQYEVCLSIYDTVFGGCYDDICKTVTVTGGGGGTGCVASFEYETDQLAVNLNNTSSGTFFAATWDYGDGAFGVDDQHVYDAPGTYSVCLTIIGFPCFDQTCQDVTVKEYTCEPAFTYSFNDQNGYQFVNTTTVGNVTSVLWDFGDGNTSTFSSPTYYYNAPGDYIVCLTTFDGDNECGMTCDTVSVYPLGVDEHSKALSMRVYPNPTDGVITVQNAGAAVTTACVLRDISGRVIWTRAMNASVVNWSMDVPAGAYTLEFESDGLAPQVVRIMVE